MDPIEAHIATLEHDRKQLLEKARVQSDVREAAKLIHSSLEKKKQINKLRVASLDEDVDVKVPDFVKKYGKKAANKAVEKGKQAGKAAANLTKEMTIIGGHIVDLTVRLEQLNTYVTEKTVAELATEARTFWQTLMSNKNSTVQQSLDAMRSEMLKLFTNNDPDTMFASVTGSQYAQAALALARKATKLAKTTDTASHRALASSLSALANDRVKYEKNISRTAASSAVYIMYRLRDGENGEKMQPIDAVKMAAFMTVSQVPQADAVLFSQSMCDALNSMPTGFACSAPEDQVFFIDAEEVPLMPLYQASMMHSSFAEMQTHMIFSLSHPFKMVPAISPKRVQELCAAQAISTSANAVFRAASRGLTQTQVDTMKVSDAQQAMEEFMTERISLTESLETRTFHIDPTNLGTSEVERLVLLTRMILI